MKMVVDIIRKKGSEPLAMVRPESRLTISDSKSTISDVFSWNNSIMPIIKKTQQ